MPMNNRQRTVIICSMVRDCAAELKHNIPFMEAVAAGFKDSLTVVFENNSRDNTKQVLRDWSASNPKVIVSINDFDESQYRNIPVPQLYLQFFSKSRISKYTDYRNMLLDLVWSTGFESDYLIMVDMDVAKIDVPGVLSTFESTLDWDAVTANGYSRSISLRRRYHDTYALCELGQENHPQDWETIMSNRIKYAHLRKGMPFVPVFSAYGGLAIFKTQAIKGLRYKVIDNNNGGVQVRCEHFSLFSQMADRGHDKVYINPGMELLYQRINFKSVLRYLKNRNTLRRFARDTGK